MKGVGAHPKKDHGHGAVRAHECELRLHSHVDRVRGVEDADQVIRNWVLAGRCLVADREADEQRRASLEARAKDERIDAHWGTVGDLLKEAMKGGSNG